MPANLTSILGLEVPIIVQIGERTLRVEDVVGLVPGAIIELHRDADDELDLLVNNKQIGTGHAVKIGENFGIRITYIGDIRERVSALGAHDTNAPETAADTATPEQQAVDTKAA